MSELYPNEAIDHAFSSASEALLFVKTQLQQGQMPNLKQLQDQCFGLCEAVLASPDGFSKALSLKFEAMLGEVERLADDVETLEKRLNERPKLPRKHGTKIYGQRAEEL